MTDQTAAGSPAGSPTPGPRRRVVRPASPARPDDGHKGSFGRVLAIAGGRGMSGAAALCGYGALRGGAGLVWLAIPESISSIVATIEPSWLTVPLPEDCAGRLSMDSQGALEQALEGKDAVAAGPGWGQSDELRQLAHWLYQSVSCPLVVDADFLNLLAGADDVLSHPGGPRILTPHPGEFARLMNCSITTVEAARETLSRQFTDRYPVTLLLKGPATVVTDQQSQYINDTGNSGMGTGGCGDVLTGLIAALVGQHMSPFEAAAFGAWLHGTAGDRAAAALSRQGLIASDLARFLPAAWQEAERTE
ncbi:MAG: NAD(P)H-hydrate dehydratase [Planctomycetaceae bacterium]|nr:NAD(P)H-hydrate dehydratase [Planctomycetaceae bacterium]